MNGSNVQWTVEVSQETDLSLRGLLDAQGIALSKFVKEAVRWRMLDQIVQGIKARNRDLPAETLELAIDENVQQMRAEINQSSA